MHQKLLSFLCGFVFVAITSPSFATQDGSALQADYLSSAKAAILLAQKIDSSPELNAALKAIDSSQLSAGSRNSEIALGSRNSEDSWVVVLLSVLVPFAMAAIGIAFAGAPGGSPSRPKGWWFASSRNTQAKLGEILTKIKYLSTDVTVTDELILALRNEARSLRRGR